MVFAKFMEKSIVRIVHQIVKADAGADKNFFHPRDGAQLAKQQKVIAMVDIKVTAWFREQALPVCAGTRPELFFTGWSAEICGRSAHIVNIALKIRLVGKSLRLP